MQIGINIAVKGVGATGPPLPPSAPVNSVPPIIYGSSDLGSLLTTTDGTWTGNPSPTLAYQWNRNGSPIPSATSSTYILVAADSAAAITCVVTATNSLGSANATSNTITAQTYSSPANTIAPVISGATALGSVLSSTTGTWIGTPAPTFAYQWRRGVTNITSATNSTYTLVVGDSAQNITCVVTATNSLGSANATSNTITAQTYSAPVNTIAPVISGTTTLGSVLTSTTGTWNGNPSPTFSFEWYRNGLPIFGETSSTYTLMAVDSNANINCYVDADNALGTITAVSNTITADNYSNVFRITEINYQRITENNNNRITQ